MTKQKISIIRDNGEVVQALSPIIVSASRSTDIPAFYADWFLCRLKLGYSAWVNPFNAVRSYVSYCNTRLIVFWSKNPKPLLKKDGILDYLAHNNINTYIQFTLNDYAGEGLEVGLPSLDSRIDTFKQLVNRLGKGRVIWRFDPLILTDTIDIDALINKIVYIGDSLYGYVEKLVFSYADITAYRKVASNLSKNGVAYKEFTQDQMLDFAQRLAKVNVRWCYDIATCGEEIDLGKFGINHNSCIDDDLMVKYFGGDKELMKYIGVELEPANLFGASTTITMGKCKKDKGQRKSCGCTPSKDIGEYNTCPHMCEYCYANSSKELAARNFATHCANKFGETISGK